MESISASPLQRRCSGENTPKRESGGFPPVRGLAWRRGPATPAAAVGLPCPKTKARRVPPGRSSCVWRLASRQTRGARLQTKTKDRRVSRRSSVCWSWPLTRGGASGAVRGPRGREPPWRARGQRPSHRTRRLSRSSKWSVWSPRTRTMRRVAQYLR